MDVFTAAPHDDVLKLVIQIATLLLVARGLGEVARRLGQPQVLGELLAGIVLGPSLLAGTFPFVNQWIVPETATQGYLLEAIALIGAMLLLFITGLEMDLALIRRHAATAFGVSAGGIVVTFSCGFILGQLLPDSLLAQPDRRLVFSLFIATAMSISAIPVIAKVLMDLNLMRRDIGQTIIAAGMSDDTVGWILLSIVAGMASGEAVTAGTVVESVGSVAAFMIVSFTAGRWLAAKLLGLVQERFTSQDRLLTLVIALAFLWGAAAQALHLEAVLGAFVAGIIFGQMPQLPASVHEKVQSMALGFFTPIFFAVAGLKVDLGNVLGDPELLGVAAVVIAVATGGKVVGTYAGARLIGRKDHWTALSFGAGLNARGAMEIIIATIGLSIGVLTQDMFSIIVMMAMATSLLAPFALRFTLARVTPGEEELERLRREEMTAASIVSRLRRVLLPIRPSDTSRTPTRLLETHILSRLAAASPISVTALAVTPPGARDTAARSFEQLGNLKADVRVNRKVVESTDVPAAILDEAARDYDLVMLGAPAGGGQTEVLFNPMVDYLVRLAPCSAMVVQGGREESTEPPRRILVPTNGSQAARRAAEVAFALATPGTEVIILNVVVIASDERGIPAALRTFRRNNLRAGQLVQSTVDVGVRMGVAASGKVLRGRDPASTILAFAADAGCDLIVLGTDLRPGSDRLFLGPGVERLLQEAAAPVLVVNMA